MSETCHTCNVIDNENHRLNDCRVYSDTNRVNHPTKFDFGDIYNDNDNILNPVFTHVDNVWEFRYANGCMKKT